MHAFSKKLVLQAYRQYHHPRYLELDPLIIVRRFTDPADQEAVALISALFAFGGVKQIKSSVETALKKINVQNGGLAKFLLAQDELSLSTNLQTLLAGFKHRIYVDQDLVALMLLYRRSCIQYGSLMGHFNFFHKTENDTIESGLIGLVQDYRIQVDQLPIKTGKFFSHMLNSPDSKSACKRWVMFLKWMVRVDDGIDLGLWQKNKDNQVNAAQLVIPLDTHLFKISKELKLTRRNAPNWNAALEVTEALKKISAEDPTRFDFSLCRLGMVEGKIRKN